MFLISRKSTMSIHCEYKKTDKLYDRVRAFCAVWALQYGYANNGIHVTGHFQRNRVYNKSSIQQIG